LLLFVFVNHGSGRALCKEPGCFVLFEILISFGILVKVDAGAFFMKSLVHAVLDLSDKEIVCLKPNHVNANHSMFQNVETEKRNRKRDFIKHISKVMSEVRLACRGMSAKPDISAEES
jgi:hypothetical protein